MKSELGFPEGENEIEVIETHVIRRLKISNLFNSILHAFNLEKGGIFTVKQLLINPGRLVLDYIGTGRLKYTAPFKILVITTTLAFLALRYSSGFQQYQADFYQGLNNEEIIKLIELGSTYFNVLLWLYIPIAGLLTWLVNIKGKFNLAENLAFQTYYFTLSNLIVIPVILDYVINTQIIQAFTTLAFLFYYVYAYKVFYSKSWLRASLEFVLIYAIATVLYLILLVLLIVLFKSLLLG